MSLGARLQEFVMRAQKLLQAIHPHGPNHLQLVESILATLEPQWRRWKQNKCPDLEQSDEKNKKRASKNTNGGEVPHKRRLLDGPPLKPDNSFMVSYLNYSNPSTKHSIVPTTTTLSPLPPLLTICPQMQSTKLCALPETLMITFLSLRGHSSQSVNRMSHFCLATRL